MNITEAIGLEISSEISEVLKKIPEIQVYANHNHFQYQWRDSRFEETSNTFENTSYDTRIEMRNALLEYLKSKGDI